MGCFILPVAPHPVTYNPSLGLSASKTSARRMIAFIFKIETFLFIWKTPFFFISKLCAARDWWEDCMCKPCWWGVSKTLLKYVHWLPSSDDFPLADRTNPAAHDYSEYIFPRNNLVLEKLDSDTFDLKINQIILDLFIFSYLLAIYYIFQWKSFLECLLWN